MRAAVLFWTGIALAFIGGATLVVPKWRDNNDGQHTLKMGDKEVTSTSGGVYLMVAGLILAGATTTLAGLPPFHGARHKAGVIPHVPVAKDPIPVAKDPSPDPGSSTPPVTPSDGPGSTPAQTLPTATPIPPTADPGPWTAEQQGLSLIVEKATLSKKFHGHEVLVVRLENRTGTDLAVPLSGFLAVDTNNESYGADNDNSSLVFDDDVPAYFTMPFKDGTTRTGTVTLDGAIQGKPSTLQVRFTVENSDNYFTVWVDTQVPTAAK